MARAASAKAVYLIDLQDGKPPHRWIVLTERDSEGQFYAVSFTDAEKYQANSYIWEEGHQLTASYKLTKNSVLKINRIVCETQGWLEEFDAVYVGDCSDFDLRDARCEVLVLQDQLRPLVRTGLAIHHFVDWEPDCGSDA